MIRLDLGCGNTKKEGFTGVDILPLDSVDIRHDLNSFPYPFEENSIEEIWMDQVLEHMENPMKVLEEIYRISKNKAKVTIGVPYFRSFYAVIDPTHKNFFGVYWFNYFDPNHAFSSKYSYSPVKFNVKEIRFDREWNFRKFSFGFHKILVILANKKPYFYERRLSHLFPLNSLTFTLEIIK